jgi:hypothetical protein
MVPAVTVRHRQTNRKNHLKTRKLSAAAIEHAVRLIHAVCGLAGSATLIDDIQAAWIELPGIDPLGHGLNNLSAAAGPVAGRTIQVVRVEPA